MNNNISAELKVMAADENTDSDQVLRLAAAVIADTRNDVADIKDKQEEQGKFNIVIKKDVEKNSSTLRNYNKAIWFIGTTGGGFILLALLASLFAGG